MRVLFITLPLNGHLSSFKKREIEELHGYIDTVAVFGGKDSIGEADRFRAIALFRREFFLFRTLSRLGIRMAVNSPQRILLREIKRRGITHVLCHSGEVAVRLINVWNRTGIPLFVHFHGTDANFDFHYNVPNKSYFSQSYKEAIIKLAKRATFIVNSQFTKLSLVKAGVPADRIQIKYLGVQVPKEGKVHKKVDGVRILHLGRLVDTKSPDRTIRAFEIAKSMGLKGTLTIAGDGSMRFTCELLRARSPFKDSIQLVGAVTSMQAQGLFKEADIFTQHNVVGELSRQAEALGISILEAMSHGIPVVVTRSGGVVETVVDGKTGIMVEPGDVEAQARAFLRLSSDNILRQRMGEAGRRHVSEHFTFEQDIRRLKEIMGLNPEFAIYGNG